MPFKFGRPVIGVVVILFIVALFAWPLPLLLPFWLILVVATSTRDVLTGYEPWEAIRQLTYIGCTVILVVWVGRRIPEVLKWIRYYTTPR